MNKCKNCIHYDVCSILYAQMINGSTEVDNSECEHFIYIAPEQHGSWDTFIRVRGEGMCYLYQCSYCAHTTRYKTEYCLNCGTKMDKKSWER